MDVWFGLLVAVLNPDKSGVSPCSLTKAAGRLLLTEQDVKTQKGHSDLVVKDGELSGYLFTATGEVIADLSVTT